MDLELGTAELLFGVMFALIAGLYSVTTYFVQRWRAKRRRATELHSDFYSGDNYRYCVLPVYRLVVKLRGLPPIKRQEYLDVVAQGWAYDPDPQSDYDNFISEREQGCEAGEAHYRLHHSTEEYTEHDALTAFLYFWVRADRLIEADLVDRKLFAELFCNGFAYYDRFLDELRIAVRAMNPPEQELAWITATERMERLVEGRK